MANIKGFIEATQSKYAMRPVVPFQTPIEIGDIGYLGRDGVWSPVSTVRHRFGVALGGIRDHKDQKGIWEDRSGKDVKFHLFGKGQTSKLVANVADAKARTEIDFSSSRSFVFAAKTVTVRSASEFGPVIEAIRSAYHNRSHLPEDRRWDANLVFVFAVGSASRLVVILADRAKTTLAVMGSGKVGPPATPAELTGRIEFGSSSNELQKVNVTNARHCFYRAYRLNPSILRKWRKEKLEEVTFSAASWQVEQVSALGGSPGGVFGPPPSGGFGGSGGRQLHVVRVSRARTPSFKATFHEI